MSGSPDLNMSDAQRKCSLWTYPPLKRGNSMPKLEREEQLALCFYSCLVTVSVLVLGVSSFYATHACKNDYWFR